MRRAAAIPFLLLGAWTLVAPQANLGLTELHGCHDMPSPAKYL